MKPRTRVPNRRLLATAAVAAMIATGLVASPTPAHARQVTDQAEVHRSDAGVQAQITWGPQLRNCPTHSSYSCLVRATGGSGWQYHYRGTGLINKWKNSGTSTRVSSHGPGSQTATVKANNSLSNPSATCQCVISPCPS